MRRLLDRQAAPAEILALLLVILFVSPLILSASDLNQQTLQAWNEYIEGTKSQMKQRLSGTASFLWIDEDPGRRERLRQGEILVEPASQNIPQKVPQGLIHDWMGAVFIPNVTIGAVFGMLNDYGQYGRFYNPAVIDAKLLNAAGATKRFSLVLAEKAPFVTAAIVSEYSTQTVRLDKHHWYTITYSTRIQQIDDYGKPEAHELPPDQGAGYIWRLYSIQRFEERDGGVYTELEAIALSRNVPFELQWLVRPILQHLPRNSMEATLQKTRDAVAAISVAKASQPVAPAAKSGGREAVLISRSRLLSSHTSSAASSMVLHAAN
jgi:hypothetical protein